MSLLESEIETMIKCEDILNDVKTLAEEAGHAILKVYETDFEVQQKQDNTPLTKADMAAHHIIEEGLLKLTPDIPVLSEESAHIDYDERKQWNQYWLVDPLDGTKEFVKRNGEFTVNIAYIKDNYPAMGVIYAPVLHLTYYACQGKGAFMQKEGESAKAIHTRKIDPENLVVAGSRSHAGSSLQRFLTQFDSHEVVSMGSSLKSCLVAQGEADIYPRFGPTSEWDTGAAQCIVEEAGGKLLDLNLERLQYNTKSALLNPHFVVVGDSEFDWARFIPKP